MAKAANTPRTKQSVSINKRQVKKLETAVLIRECMMHFWNRGYRSTSIDDLVTLTGCSRHSIYNQIGNKETLFSCVLEQYSKEIVTPAFSLIEQPGSTLEDIRRFFYFQFDLAESNQGLVKGCLITNSIPDLPFLNTDSQKK